MSITENKLEILETISRYSHGADGIAAEAYAGVFTEDGIFKGRSGQPDEITLKGHEQLKAFHHAAVAGRGSRRNRHHQSTTIFLEMTENRAVTRTYLLTTTVLESGPPMAGVTSIYEDEFVKTPDGWRIKCRQILPDVKGSLRELQRK
jgi:hypothetical protein